MKKKFLFSVVLITLFFLTTIDNVKAQLSSCGIDTAIGCIPVTDSNEFMAWMLKWAIGLGGGIAFLLIIYSGFIIMTSRGDPKRLVAGQELLTSAIMGLILLIFSVFLLKIVGVNLLDIKGFSI